MDKEILKTIMIRGMWDDYLAMLNLLGKWDISKEYYDEIVQLYWRSSRGSTINIYMTHDASTGILKSINSRESRNWKPTRELQNWLYELVFLSTWCVSSEAKNIEVEHSLAIFYSRCRNKHPLRECSLNHWNICEWDNSTGKWTSFSVLKEIYKGAYEDTEVALFIGTKNPWQPCSLGMVQEPFTYCNSWCGMYSPQKFPQQMQYLIAPWHPPNAPLL